MEQNVVSGIAYARDEAKVTLLKIADKPGVAAQVFGPLADANINVDMIVQNVSEDGFTDLTFTVQSADFDRAIEVLKKSQGQPSAMPICAAPPTSPRCRPSASACAAMPALPRKCSARLPKKASISRRSRPPRSKSAY